ncbi:MAG: response regulator [Gammaproteobacteria bacterium]|nr:response regulator [Gammaproteobacteria bacterium]
MVQTAEATTPKNHILVVEDDPDMRELVAELLQRNDFEVTTVGTAFEMDRVLSRHLFDLMILDLLLPGEDGLSVAKRLKEKIKMPIIMLSALDAVSDRVKGLDLGADDYIGKPFNPHELIARIRAVLRRVNVVKQESPVSLITFGDFELDLQTNELTKNGKRILLTSSEINLLKLFVDAPYQIVDRDYIQTKLDGFRRDTKFRAVDIRVLRLRNKIEAQPRTPQFIKTIWGKGYMFCPNVV